MPRRNRVTPFGAIVASPHRGLLMGNRGCLHEADGQPSGRRWTTRTWVTCRLSFRDRPPRRLMSPGRYTELFFLDEATALAAGHRPCGECRRADYRRFLQCWSTALGLAALPRAPEVDRRLHDERVSRRHGQVRFTAAAGDLPDGAMIDWQGDAFLKWQGVFRPWSLAGYGDAVAIPAATRVSTLTPRSTVGAIAAGYRPVVHASAGAASVGAG
jgi:hypothetical protein